MASANYIIKLFGEAPPSGPIFKIQLCSNSSITGYIDLYPNLQIGDVIFASGATSDGDCFQIVEIVENETADFTPIELYPNCQSCIKCQGASYRVTGCTTTGELEIQVFKPVITGSNIQINYDCYNVLEGILTDINTQDYIMYGFVYCTENCDLSGKKLVLFEDCLGDFVPPIIGVYANSGITSGDTIAIKYNEYIIGCGNVTEVLSSGNTSGVTLFFDSTQISDCNACGDFLTYQVLAYTKCNDTGTTYYAIFTYETFLQAISGNTFFHLMGADCYQLLEISSFCPFQQNFPILRPKNFFPNCEECYEPYSAGTEDFFCINDCSGSTYTVSGPHPVWTNLQGRAVTLLDAFVLGGPNGLNS